MAWRIGEEGAALNWWIDRIREDNPIERLLRRPSVIAKQLALRACRASNFR